MGSVFALNALDREANGGQRHSRVSNGTSGAENTTKVVVGAYIWTFYMLV